jgi:hypothetical protein
MLKKYYSCAAAKEGEAKKDDGDGDVGGFPAVENVFLIFGGPTVDMSNSQCKQEQHEVLAAEKAPPSFLDWSEDAITFSREDHPNRIPNPGQYPLVVDPVIGNSRFSNVLMDRGSSLNILYAHTLRLMGIGLDHLRPSMTSFHGIAPGKRVQPLGQINLPVWFGTSDNFRKETLTFEVVEFRRVYHAILGRPCYAKFMAVPNYIYLKMKMSGPKRVITMGSSIEHAFDCDVECWSTRRTWRSTRRLLQILRYREAGQRGPRLLRQARGQLRGCRANEGGAPRPCCPQGQDVDGQFHPRLEIGSGARRLPLRQRRHLRLEPLGHARHSEGGRRALP